MRHFKNSAHAAQAIILVALGLVGCTRSISVSPVSVFTPVVPSPTSTFVFTATNIYTSTPTGTPTQTLVPANTNTPTWSPTNTFTGTITSTPTPTNTAVPGAPTDTSTFSPTVTFTDTVTSTPTPTNTAVPGAPTDTSTFSPTVTFTDTVTSTPTPTNTAVPGAPTDTSTFSPTVTFTDTVTSTPTPTNTTAPGVPTNTVTYSPTVTSTITSTPGITMTPVGLLVPCTNPAFQSTYNFTNGLQCWTVDASSTYVTGIGTISSVQHNGNNVLCVTVNNTSATTIKAQIELNYGVTQNWTGAAVTAYVSADPSLTGPSTLSGTMGAVFFDQNASYNWDAANYVNLSTTANTWSTCYTNPVANTGVLQFGIQVYNIAPGVSGNIYIADVSINVPVPATSTFTATMTATPTITSTFALSPTYTLSPTSTSTGVYSPTVTATVTSTATTPGGCTLLLNDGSNLTINGNWKGNNATISLATGLHGTTSANSVDLNITNTSNYSTVATLDTFIPSDFTNATQLVLDYYADASIVSANGWAQFALQGNGATTLGANFWGQTISPDQPGVTGGAASSVTFTLNPYGRIDQLTLILNTGVTLTSGNIYIGDIKLIYSPACPPVPVPIAADSFNFENQSLTNTLGTWIDTAGTAGVAQGIGIVSPGQGSSYGMGVTGTWTAAYQSLDATIYFNPTNINASSFNGVEAWVYAPPGSFPSGAGVFLQVADGGANYPESGWFNINPGGWTYLNFPVSAWLTANPTFDLTNLHMIQIIVQDKTGVTETESVVIDNVNLY